MAVGNVCGSDRRVGEAVPNLECLGSGTGADSRLNMVVLEEQQLGDVELTGQQRGSVALEETPINCVGGGEDS